MMEGNFDSSELDKLVRRDPAAVERWFRRCVDAVFTFVYYKSGRDSELAGDIVQDTFLEGIGKIRRYDSGRGGMTAWLIYLSRNHIKKALRDRKKFSKNPDSIRFHLESLNHCKQLSSEVMPDEIVQSMEMAELVKITLANIPANYAEALRARYYRGKSLRQIADVRRISEAAAKVLLHRARKSFEKIFVGLAGDSSVAYRKDGEKDE